MKDNYNFKKRFTLLIALFCLSFEIFSQVSTYTFSSSSGTYTPITGGAVVTSGTSDDNTFGALNIGFTFTYNGVAYTQFGLNVNGWISMGAVAPTSSYVPISGGTTNNIISAMGRDLQLGFTSVGDRTTGSNIISNVTSTAGFAVGDVLLTATGFPAGTTITAVGPNSLTVSNNATTTGTAGAVTVGGEIRYETIGSAPNRVCVVQWTRARRFGTATTTGRNCFYNFQITLEETTNNVNIIYGTVITNATLSTYEIGLRGVSNADFNNRTTTTDWAATSAGAVNNATMDLSTSVFPASGQTFTWAPPSGCAGMPSAGTTTSSANPVCSGVNFTLTIPGSTVASGLTYQWQSSTDGITYNNITGGTTASFSTNQSVATYYQAIVTCTASGLADTSAPLNITMNAATNCYCTSTATSTADEDILNVTLGSLNNTSTCSTTGGPGSVLNLYSDFTAVAAPVLTQGTTYPFSVQVGTCGGSFTNSTRIFIDYNQNGLFTDPGEIVYTSATGTVGPHLETGNISVPIAAVTGNTRMRVVTVETGTPTSINPCGTYSWGETEDYTINIIAAAVCSGTPSAGITQSTAPSVCSGTSFTLSTSTPPTGLSGITYVWQSSPDGITYTNIAGATSATYTTSQATSTYYQAIVSCTASGMSDTTTAIQVTMNPFTNCYCTSSATNTADEDILNVSLGTLNNTSTCATTGGPGSVLNRYSDYTTVAPAPNLAQTAVYPVSIQVGTCGGTFTNSTRIFIDFNHNGLFTDAGETVYTSAAGTAGAHTETGNITIPVGALTGNTRMRVITVETGTPTSITPCGTYGWGETEDYFVNIVPLPPNPPTPVQNPSTPTCSTGTDLTVPGSPAAGDAWYWQTAASGTSTANPVAGPYTVFLNGTYYVRTYNATNNVWSAGSDSVTVSNIPVAATPPAPTAVSPACLSTAISIAAPSSGTAYFWQGINSTGTSNSQNASAPLNVTASGTYYVAAYDSLTSCWSNTNNISVVINTYVPAAPMVTNDTVMICQGVASALVNATANGSDSVIVSFGTNLQSPGPATPFTITVPAIPAGATITSTQLQVFDATAINGSWRSEMRVALSGATTLAATQLSTLSSGGIITPNPVITIPNLPLSGGSVTLTLSETFDDGGAATTDATFSDIRIVIHYTLPPSTINWWNASTAGTMQGTGSPFETVGTSVLPNSNTAGTYLFYADASSGSCTSSRTPVTVIVNPLPVMVLSDTAICAGSPYILNAQNTGSTYLWNTAQTSQSISISTAGLYYVDITTSAGCSKRDSMNLIINNPPIVDLGGDVAFCTGDSILLDAANTGFTFLWNNSATSQTINASTGGNYFVTVTNPATMCAASDSILVTVNPLPVVNLGVDTAFCTGDSIVLNAGNPGDTYSWNTSATTQMITVNTPSSYFVFVSDPVTGCFKSDTVIISQNVLPVVNLGADTAICNGTTLTLDAGNAGSTYVWSNASAGQTLGVTSAGSYGVLVTDPNGCRGNDTVNVSINPLPIVNLGSDTVQCAGTVVLNAGNTGSSFSWNDLSTAQTLTASSTGNYYVTVTDANACSATDTVGVIINPLPVLNLGSDINQCGGPIILDAGNPGFTHLWYDSSTGQTLTVYSSNTVNVTVTNPVTGCVASDTITITLNQNPVVNLGNDITQCGGSVTLNAGNAGASYVWSTAASTQTISANASGAYSVSVTASGCTASDTIMVTINPLPFVGFPAIAPVCSQVNSIVLNGTPAGGIFSGGPEVSGGMFFPGIAGPGAHSVMYTVTDTNSCSNSFIQTINVNDCTGIEETTSLSETNIYPNPSNGMFTVVILNANYKELVISITDIQGKEVYSSSVKNIAGDYNKQIALDGIAKGIYYIKLTADSNMQIRKLIIN